MKNHLGLQCTQDPGNVHLHLLQNDLDQAFNNCLDLLHNNIRFYYILYILKVPLKSKFDVLITVEIRIQNFSVRLQTMFICKHVWGGGNGVGGGWEMTTQAHL